MFEFIGLIGLMVRVVAEIIGLYVIFSWMIKTIRQDKVLLKKEITKGKLIKELRLKYKYGKISDEELNNKLYEIEKQ